MREWIRQFHKIWLSTYGIPNALTTLQHWNTNKKDRVSVTGSMVKVVTLQPEVSVWLWSQINNKMRLLTLFPDGTNYAVYKYVHRIHPKYFKFTLIFSSLLAVSADSDKSVTIYIEILNLLCNII